MGMGSLDGKTIALAITGSIAAYKAVELARLFVKAGAKVIPVMTKSAQKLVGPVTLSGICGERSSSGARAGNHRLHRRWVTYTEHKKRPVIANVASSSRLPCTPGCGPTRRPPPTSKHYEGREK